MTRALKIKHLLYLTIKIQKFRPTTFIKSPNDKCPSDKSPGDKSPRRQKSHTPKAAYDISPRQRKPQA